MPRATSASSTSSLVTTAPTLYMYMGSSPTRGSLGKVTALFVCLTLLASFFLPSHLSLKHVYTSTTYTSLVNNSIIIIIYNNDYFVISCTAVNLPPVVMVFGNMQVMSVNFS